MNGNDKKRDQNGQQDGGKPGHENQQGMEQEQSGHQSSPRREDVSDAEPGQQRTNENDAVE